MTADRNRIASDPNTQPTSSVAALDRSAGTGLKLDTEGRVELRPGMKVAASPHRGDYVDAIVEHVTPHGVWCREIKTGDVFGALIDSVDILPSLPSAESRAPVQPGEAVAQANTHDATAGGADPFVMAESELRKLQMRVLSVLPVPNDDASERDRIFRMIERVDGIVDELSDIGHRYRADRDYGCDWATKLPAKGGAA